MHPITLIVLIAFLFLISRLLFHPTGRIFYSYKIKNNKIVINLASIIPLKKIAFENIYEIEKVPWKTATTNHLRKTLFHDIFDTAVLTNKFGGDRILIK